MAVADELNRALADCREFDESPLAAAYRAEYLRAAREISAAFMALTASADWTPPTVEQITNWSISMSRIRGAQRRMMGRIGGRMNEIPGVDFNLTQPVVQRLLNQLAVRAEQVIRDGVRTPVAHAIARGWAEGRTVPQTAALIREAVVGVSGWKATMLARTDLIGLSNGAGQSAVGKLNEAAAKNGEPKPIGSKTWTNAGDSRVRETHQEAEGQTVPIDQPYRVGGQSLSYPGDPFGPSEEVLNCRCVEIFNEAPSKPAAPPTPVEAEPAGERASFASVVDVRDMPILGQNQGAIRALQILDQVMPKGLSSNGPLRREMARKAELFEGMDTRLPIQTEKLQDAHGEYRFVGNSAVKIAINRSSPHPASTALHELGHWLDHQELVDGPGFATSGGGATPEMAKFVQVVSESKAAAQLRELRTMNNIRVGSGADAKWVQVGPESRRKIEKYVSYLEDPVEQWARAFAQWSARKSGSPTVNREIDDQIFDDRNPKAGFYETHTQWDDDDFGPISDAVEGVLRARGLLDPGEITAAVFRVFLLDVVPRFLVPVESGGELDRLLPGEARHADDPVDDVVLADTGFSEFLRGDHPTSVSPGEPGWSPLPPLQGSASKWWPESAASYWLDTAVPFSATYEEDPMPRAVEMKPVLRVVDKATGADVTDQYVAIESNGEVVGFAADVAEVPAASTTGAAWHSDIAFEGLPTGDGRFMVPGSLSWREPPLTLMAMVETTEGGHLGAQISGRMDDFAKRDVDMDGAKLPKDVTSIYSTGVFDGGDYGSDIERMVADETLRGISVDLSVQEWAFRDPETGEIIDPETASDEEWERAFMGDLDFAVLKGTVMAATVCPTPAFAEARIALAAAGGRSMRHVWRAGSEYALAHGIETGQIMTTLTASLQIRPPALTASAFARAPIRPNLSAFTRPEAAGPQPITLHDDGTLSGHLCLWKSCHTGFLSGQFQECIRPPRSYIDYADFHLGGLPLEDGEVLPVGKLTVDTGHADPYADRLAARSHYDHTGTVVAFVRASDGKHGVWLSGAIKSDATDEQIRDLLACPLSGDWRAYNGNLELQAALAVVIPGFPVAAQRAQLALSASGAPMTLILPSNVERDVELGTVGTFSGDVLAASIEGTLDEFIQADCDCV